MQRCASDFNQILYVVCDPIIIICEHAAHEKVKALKLRANCTAYTIMIYDPTIHDLYGKTGRQAVSLI